MSLPLHSNDTSTMDNPARCCCSVPRILPQTPSSCPDTFLAFPLTPATSIHSPASVSSTCVHTSSSVCACLPPDPHYACLSRLHIARLIDDGSSEIPLALAQLTHTQPANMLHSPPLSRQSLLQNHSHLHRIRSIPIKLEHPQPHLAHLTIETKDCISKTTSLSYDSSRPVLPCSLADLIQDCFCMSIGSEPLLSPSTCVTDFIKFVSERHCLENLNFLIAIHEYERACGKTVDTKEDRAPTSTVTLCNTLGDQNDQVESISSHDSSTQYENSFHEDTDSISLYSTQNQEHLSSLWQSIHTTFLQEGSPEEINLSQAARDDIANSGMCCDCTHLQRAKREVLSLLKENVYMDYFALQRRHARECLSVAAARCRDSTLTHPGETSTTAIPDKHGVSPRSRLNIPIPQSPRHLHCGKSRREHHGSAATSLVSLLSVLKPSKHSRSSPDIEATLPTPKTAVCPEPCCQVSSESSRKFWFKKPSHH